MLLSKTVKMNWSNRIKTYYESKGYKFTKYGDVFEVKIEDLSDGSMVLINTKCDGCGEILENIIWKDYKKCVHEDGSYYCQRCANNGNKKWISFYDWCIENDREDLLNRWDYELNDCSPKEITYSTTKKFWFKCPRGIHPSELKYVVNITQNKQKNLICDKCNSFAQWGYDNIDNQFLEKYWDYEKNIDKNGNPIDPWKISYGCRTKIYIFCQDKDYHDSYDINCYAFTNGNRCPFCSGHKIHKYDSLGYLYPQVFDIWSEKNKKSPYDYSPFSEQKVYWRCLESKHKDYYREISCSNQRGFRCAECVKERYESIIQEKTRLYLGFLGYKVLHEENCTLVPRNIIEPPNHSNKKRSKRILKYDNEIIINNNKHLFIEVMGKQHKYKCSWHEDFIDKYNTTIEEEFQYQVQKDKYKEQYVYDQGENYYYLAVWYYDFENSMYQKLIDDKINQILNKELLEAI